MYHTHIQAHEEQREEVAHFLHNAQGLQRQKRESGAQDEVHTHRSSQVSQVKVLTEYIVVSPHDVLHLSSFRQNMYFMLLLMI